MSASARVEGPGPAGVEGRTSAPFATITSHLEQSTRTHVRARTLSPRRHIGRGEERFNASVGDSHATRSTLLIPLRNPESEITKWSGENVYWCGRHLHRTSDCLSTIWTDSRAGSQSSISDRQNPTIQEPDGSKGKKRRLVNETPEFQTEKRRVSQSDGFERWELAAAQMENGDGYGRMSGWAIHASRQSSSQNRSRGQYSELSPGDQSGITKID